MINDLIEEIIKAEKRADDNIAAAKEEAKAMLVGMSAKTDALYEKAEAELKKDVENILTLAEKDAEAAAAAAFEGAKKQTAATIEKVESKFNQAVKRVCDALLSL